MIEITDEMVSRFMSGSLRAYDIKVDKYVDFTRKSALSFLGMVLNPVADADVVVTNTMLKAGLDACALTGRGDVARLDAAYRAMHAARPKEKAGQLHAHGRAADKIQGEWVSNWHRRSGDPV